MIKRTMRSISYQLCCPLWGYGVPTCWELALCIRWMIVLSKQGFNPSYRQLSSNKENNETSIFLKWADAANGLCARAEPTFFTEFAEKLRSRGVGAVFAGSGLAPTGFTFSAWEAISTRQTSVNLRVKFWSRSGFFRRMQGIEDGNLRKNRSDGCFSLKSLRVDWHQADWL